MAELPEIEARKEQIRGCLGGTIDHVEVYHDDILEGITRQGLQGALANHQIVDVQRKGKNLLFFTDRGATLLLTMAEGATVTCIPSPANEHPSQVEVVIYFEDGHAFDFVIPSPKDRLYFFPTQDLRLIPPVQELGPEPEEMEYMEFRKRLQTNPDITIWEALNIQRYVSGLGPAYVDEILYQARVRPDRKVTELLRKDWEAIYDKMQEIIRVAKEVGGDRQKLDSRGFLINRRGTDRGCPSCHSPLAVLHFGDRNIKSYYCPKCPEREKEKHEGFW